ncbi:glycosyltransferase family 8 protein [Butyrivibrio fibrisolvens]|uniref:glycosyltransferase family 8 protein n=1 Tax=Butyrivibrio fibrisolvens TaxID=831 RepID=UPI0003B33FA3|nr:glycosyltransferase family 8 protein [Butyrivibrio fibrisolvens]
MNCVYATDDNYAYLAGISIESLLKNNMEESEINIYILDDEISENNKIRLNAICDNYHREIHYINTKEFLSAIGQITTVSYNSENKISYTAYARLFIDRLLPLLEKVIYIDCDTLVVGKLHDLYEMKFPDEYALGMVADCTQREYIKSLEVSEEAIYYNSGIMLIDIQKWRNCNFTDSVLKHMKEVRGNYPLVDQDIINVCLNKYIYKIPLTYNVQSPNFMYYTYHSICSAYGLSEKNYYSAVDHSVAMDNPTIIHFSGSSFIRPWYYNSNHPLKELYMSYYKESLFYNEDFYEQNKYNAPLSATIRFIMYKVLPSNINGVISGLILKRWIQKMYLGENALWNRKNL